MARPLRFTLIVALTALGTSLAAVGGWRYARVSAPVNGPIILISIDTLRADHLPVYGYEKVRTPAIDGLAADGVVFDRAYSHAPQTLPAHAAMLTGRLPFQNGVRDNVAFTIKKSERLLPQMLHDRGYGTAGIVSAYVLKKETGIARGFDFFDGEMPAASPEVPIGQVQRDGTASEQIAEHWIDSYGSARFFLFLHLYEPHKPYTPPARFAQYAPYDGEIAYSDEIVGHFIAFLRARQLYDRSTIVLVSDHGEGLGDHGEQEHGLFVYDEAIHVPLIIKTAGQAGAHRRVTDPVQHVDLVPTLLDLAGAPIPSNLSGRSLKPLLDGTGRLPERSIYSEALYGRYHFGWSELTALTDGRYRYIRAPREELYDLANDPHERDNIAAARAQAASAMRGALATLLRGTKLQAPSAVSAEERERLQSLGYVGATTAPADAPADTLPDPKDKREILEQYRLAVDFAADRRFPQALTTLQAIVAEDPQMSDVWGQLALYGVRAGRFNVALDAYQHFIELKPSDASGYIGAATVLLGLQKLDDARKHAEAAVEAAGDADVRNRASAHELLARIALASRDEEAARSEAALAEKADPTLPMTSYVEARLRYDRGEYADALPFFEQTIEQERQRGRTLQMPEVHYLTGDTLGRLERYPEAEAEFQRELRFFPDNARARSGLAMLYQATGRSAEAEQTIADMLRITPTPDSYALAARLWTMFGNPRQADAVRAQARREFAQPTRVGGRAARH